MPTSSCRRRRRWSGTTTTWCSTCSRCATRLVSPRPCSPRPTTSGTTGRSSARSRCVPPGDSSAGACRLAQDPPVPAGQAPHPARQTGRPAAATGRSGCRYAACAPTPRVSISDHSDRRASGSPADQDQPHRPRTAGGAGRPRRLADVPRPDPDRDGDPLLLIGRRHQRDCNSWMHNADRLTRGRPRHQLFMHPDDLAARGVVDGEHVAVTSDVGRVEVEVIATDDVMRGVVCLPHGYGHARTAVPAWPAADGAGGLDQRPHRPGAPRRLRQRRAQRRAGHRGHDRCHRVTESAAR